jgi:hypothetical protein
LLPRYAATMKKYALAGNIISRLRRAARQSTEKRRARRWSFCRQFFHKHWNSIAVIAPALASATRDERKKRILFRI